MKVAARIAAKNFLRRSIRRRRSARPWLPVALRWRHERSSPKAQIHRCGAPFVAQSWFTQFHMHFSVAAASVREKPEKMRSIHHSAMMRRSVRLVSDRLATPFNLVLPLPDRSRASSVQGILVRRERSYDQTMLRQTTLHLSSRRVERATVTLLEFRQKTVMRTLPCTAMEVRSPSPPSPRPIASVPLAIAPARRRGVVGTAPEPEARVRLPAIRTPELAWRKPERSSPDAESERAGGTAMRNSVQRTGAVFSNPPSRAVSQTQSVASARPLVLDSATFDRLAEDVIRRVERHIRIERERRGV
jgi:hypothetical protein